MKFTLALLTLATAVKVHDDATIPDDAALADLEAQITEACSGADLEACNAAVEEYTAAMMDMEEYYFDLYGDEYGYDYGDDDEDVCDWSDDTCWEAVFEDYGDDNLDVCDLSDDTCWEAVFEDYGDDEGDDDGTDEDDLSS